LTANGRPPPARLHRWRRGALVLAFFTALAVVNSYPLAFRAGSVIGQHGDALFSVWRLAWVAHQITADPRHLFDANIFYPERRTLAFSDAMLLPAAVVAPLNWAGIEPLAVYNLTLLAAFVLSGLAAYLLVRHLTGSTAAGLLGGVVYAFSPYRIDHFDHLELQFAFWIPLTVLAWHRAAVNQSIHGYLQVAALASGQILSSIYYGVFLLTWLAAVTPVWFLRTPLKAVKGGVLMLLPPLLVLAIYSLPYVENRKRLGDRAVSEISDWSARTTDFLSAPETNVLYGWTHTLAAPERHLFPGVTAAVLLVVGLWPPWNRVRVLHAAGLALALQLALGANGILYPFLYDWILPYRGLRVPARAAILVLLGTAVLAGFGLSRLIAHRRRWVASMIATSLIGVAAAEYLARPRIDEVDRPVSGWYESLRTMPDAVVFEWPVTVPWRIHHMVDVLYMYRSTRHWRPLLNGYSGFYPDTYMKLLLEMRSFPDTNTLRYLQRAGATVLVVHEVQGSRPSYDYALERLARDPNVQVLAQDRDAGQRVTFFRLYRSLESPPR
jgi:hypothetical protein